MTDLGPEQSQVPPQNIKSPTAIWVLGTLGIVHGLFHLFRMSRTTYNTVIEMQKYPETTRWAIIFVLISTAFAACFWIWQIIVGWGLFKMKKWSRRWALIYAWIQLVLNIAITFYSTIIIFTGLINPPQGRWPFWFIYMQMMLMALIYPILLLIFMQTKKVKQAFSAIGG